VHVRRARAAFLSSRRRHTRFSRDWSSDVCTSDLYHKINRIFSSHLVAFIAFEMLKKKHPKLDLYNLLRLPEEDLSIDYQEFRTRSEERRVGKEGSDRWARDHAWENDRTQARDQRV